MPYIYNDEDNQPMSDDALDFHNPTVYGSLCEMKAAESIPFDGLDDKPADGCWNCFNFDWKHEACTLRWNNLDESYYNPDLDDRELTDCCEYHDTDPDIDPEEVDFGGNEP